LQHIAIMSLSVFCEVISSFGNQLPSSLIAHVRNVEIYVRWDISIRGCVITTSGFWKRSSAILNSTSGFDLQLRLQASRGDHDHELWRRHDDCESCRKRLIRSYELSLFECIRQMAPCTQNAVAQSKQLPVARPSHWILKASVDKKKWRCFM